MAQKKTDEIEVSGFLRFSKVISWLMYIWVMIGVVALGLRVFLLAFSANTTTGFGNFVMEVSGDYLRPFRGIFELREVGETGYLDVSAIFAIIIYLFVAWGFKSLIEYVQDKIDTSKREQKQAQIREEWSQVLASQKQARAKSPARTTTKKTTTTTTTRG
jgi:uncharacterized protein YggT (Ycf19 family)